MAKKEEHRDLFPGALEMMILHSLRLKPMHGYALVKHIRHVESDSVYLHIALLELVRDQRFNFAFGAGVVIERFRL